MRTTIERFLIVGDSLSDKGTMARSSLAALSGLDGKSPDGRFTNGYAWIDFFCEMVFRSATSSTTTSSESEPIFTHNDDQRVTTSTSQDFVRTYCIGGMTAHNYTQRVSADLVLDITEEILANLDSMRKKIQEDDASMVISAQQKADTLVIEWSGANDLITINKHPTIVAAELAAQARINHLETMIAMGYQHFVLFNLPDLSLTPRFQKQGKDKQKAAQDSVEHLNTMLALKIKELSTKYPPCSIILFDANLLFKDTFNNPTAFGLDEDKKHSPFIESKAFKDTDEQSIAKGYMFWDDVHPTEAIHKRLADDLYQNMFSSTYNFRAPEESLLNQFRESYGKRWDNDLASCFGFFRRSRIDYKQADLTTILKHAIHGGGHRTMDIIVQLGWVHPNKQLATDHPLICEAMKVVEGSVHPNTQKSHVH